VSRRTRPGRVLVGLVALAALAAGCSGGGTTAPATSSPAQSSAGVAAPPAPTAADDPSGPEFPSTVPTGRRPVVADGDDWTMPAWVRPAAYSGFFSEQASPPDHVMVRSVDVSWRQIAPTPDGPLDLTSSGEAQGMFFDSLGEQLDQPGPYWVRLFASGVDWAPTWVIDQCGVGPVGTDYDGQEHLPIWDDCVWSAMRDTWEKLLVDQRILADPDFRFAYVPGGFTWVEYDYDVISQAARHGLVTRDAYLAWFDRMLADLAEIAGPQVGQLVFTGEDYPWGPFGHADDLLATDAVERGFGIRTGITEEFNFHLNQTPAYGSTIRPDGHLAMARGGGPRPGTLQVFGTENECYVSCGYHAQDPAYDVVMSNLKALQLQMNWVYVVPGDSLLDPVAQHWDWVRLSLGQRRRRPRTRGRRCATRRTRSGTGASCATSSGGWCRWTHRVRSPTGRAPTSTAATRPRRTASPSKACAPTARPVSRPWPSASTHASWPPTRPRRCSSRSPSSTVAAAASGSAPLVVRRPRCGSRTAATGGRRRSPSG